MGARGEPGVVYRALNEDQKEIRLLHIQPAQHQDDYIYCSLSTARLDNVGINETAVTTCADLGNDSGPRCEALSYVWGSLSHETPIYLQGQPKAVTVNLYQALQHLRHFAQERVMWIDAICIDQSNLDERSHQVGMMGDIFKQASNTMIWLGQSSSEECGLAMRFFERMASDDKLHLDPSLTPHVEIDSKNMLSAELMTGLGAFFGDPWWSRVWTLQEYVLSRRLTFQCGPHLLDGQVLRLASDAWIGHLAMEPCCIPFGNHLSNSVDLHRFTRALDEIADIRELFNQLTLPAIVGQLRTRLATDPRDKVYGMLGLAHGKYEKAVVADYTKSVEDAFEAVTIQMIKSTGSLEILSNSSASLPSRLHIPSWVPDWTVSYEDRLAHRSFTTRIGSLHVYNACRDEESNMNVIGPGRLQLNGIIVDIIDLCPDFDFNAFWRFDVLKSAANNHYARTKDRDVQSYASDFWPTMCGSVGLSRDGTSVQRISEDQDRYDELLIKLATWSVKMQPDKAKAFDEDFDIRAFVSIMRSANVGRRFIITKSGRLGWCPETCQQGDTITVLAGGRVPYVLRKTDDRCHTFLGDAYVHGIMDGEAVEEMHQRGGDWEKFTLV